MAVERAESFLVLVEVVERHVLLLGAVINEDRMSLRERPSPRILTRDTDHYALHHQRAECERLGGGPVHRIPFEQVGAFFDHLLELWMWLETLGKAGHLGKDVIESVALDTGIYSRDRIRRRRGGNDDLLGPGAFLGFFESALVTV